MLRGYKVHSSVLLKWDLCSCLDELLAIRKDGGFIWISLQNMCSVFNSLIFIKAQKTLGYFTEIIYRSFQIQRISGFVEIFYWWIVFLSEFSVSTGVKNQCVGGQTSDRPDLSPPARLNIIHRHSDWSESQEVIAIPNPHLQTPSQVFYSVKRSLIYVYIFCT